MEGGCKSIYSMVHYRTRESAFPTFLFSRSTNDSWAAFHCWVPVLESSRLREKSIMAQRINKPHFKVINLGNKSVIYHFRSIFCISSFATSTAEMLSRWWDSAWTMWAFHWTLTEDADSCIADISCCNAPVCEDDPSRISCTAIWTNSFFLACELASNSATFSSICFSSFAIDSWRAKSIIRYKRVVL